MKTIKYLFFIVIVLVVDYLTKQWAADVVNFSLIDTEYFQIAIHYVTNKGTFWGALSNHTTFLLFVRLFVVSVLLFYIFMHGLRLSTSAMLAGAIGNMWGSLRNGYVVDMLYISIFDTSPGIFNVADMFILFGMFLFICCDNKQKK